MKRLSVTDLLAFLWLLFLSGGMVSCGGDNLLDGPSRAGTLTLRVETDTRAVTAGGLTVDTGFDEPQSEISLTLADLTGAYSHTWADAQEFPQGEYFLSGSYLLSGSYRASSPEGFDSPSYSGSVNLSIEEGKNTETLLTLSLDKALVKARFDSSIDSDFSKFSLLVHTPGGQFFEIQPGENRILCLNPAHTGIFAELTMPDGRQARLLLLTRETTVAATLYEVEVSSETTPDGVKLLASWGDESTSILITDRLLDDPAPAVTLSWDPDKIISLPEGETSPQPLVAKVSGSDVLGSVMLSTDSRSLCEDGFPAEVDLLHLTHAQDAALRSMGLVTTETTEGLEIDFTALTSQLYYIDELNRLSRITLLAIGADGQIADPAVLTIASTPVEMTVTPVGPVTMGVDRGELIIECQSSSFASNVEILVADKTTGNYLKATPLEITPITTGSYKVGFPVPEGIGPVDVKVNYCNEERASVSLEREMPDYKIEVDAFATMAVIRVVPSDDSLLEAITSATSVYIDNVAAPSYLTDPDLGIITVIGLTPGRSYTFKATMMGGSPSPEFTKSVTASTEQAPQLPNCDFEERQDGPSYKSMPSGGRYSRTHVEIFNMQHFTDFSTETPKQWANTNAKTFAGGSANINTWYLQPSAYLTRDPVFSQSFAVELVSTAFDPKGQSIPPYAQTSQPYLDYSPIVPEIAYRAAGKLFLGSYSYDPATVTETYNEGIAWSSRPMSLNGYYRFRPCDADRNDCGLARVELLGKIDGRETVIASGETRLALALSYTAFSVPLSYKYYGVKATRIKVMFASSASIGTIADETSSIVTVADPVHSRSLGSRLWIDNVTLAY